MRLLVASVPDGGRAAPSRPYQPRRVRPVVGFDQASNREATGRCMPDHRRSTCGSDGSSLHPGLHHHRDADARVHVPDARASAVIGGLGADLLGAPVVAAGRHRRGALGRCSLFTMRPLLLRRLRRGEDPTPTQRRRAARPRRARHVATSSTDGGQVKLANGETWTARLATARRRARRRRHASSSSRIDGATAVVVPPPGPQRKDLAHDDVGAVHRP